MVYVTETPVQYILTLDLVAATLCTRVFETRRAVFHVSNKYAEDCIPCTVRTGT